jgi:hypothetical protein
LIKKPDRSLLKKKPEARRVVSSFVFVARVRKARTSTYHDEGAWIQEVVLALILSLSGELRRLSLAGNGLNHGVNFTEQVEGSGNQEDLVGLCAVEERPKSKSRIFNHAMPHFVR